MEIGFLGLGAMGQAMARNLIAAGHRVKAWNRSPATLEGGTIVTTPAEVFDAEATLTMLSEDAVIRDVVLLPNLLQQARQGLVHIVSATVSVAFAHELARAHEQAGVAYLAAPVLGRPDAAARAELHILAAGAPAALHAVEPILQVLGRKTWVLGTDPAAANAAKIACNMMITMAIEAMAEALVLTEANGLARQAFLDLILGTLFGARAYQVYAANIAQENYEPGFKATLGLKDLRLAREAAGAAGRALPMLDAVHQRMADMIADGGKDRDWSAIADFTLKH